MADIWKVQDEAGTDYAVLDDSGNLTITGKLIPTVGKLVTCTHLTYNTIQFSEGDKTVGFDVVQQLVIVTHPPPPACG